MLPPLQEITLQAETSRREKMSSYSVEAISVLYVTSTVITFSGMNFTLLINIYNLLLGTCNVSVCGGGKLSAWQARELIKSVNT